MNNIRSNALTIGFYLFSALIFYGLSAESALAEGGHHGTHVHGIAHLNVALENNELYIEFKSPAANIVGFEHSTENHEEEAAIKEAVKILKAGEDLIHISSRAGAMLEESIVKTSMETDEHHEAEHHESEHHEKHQSVDKASEDGHHHDHEKEGDETHSDFKVVYRFHCNHLDKLKYIDVMLFNHFKGIEEIEVQVLTDTKQTAFELTPRKNRVTF